VTRIWEGTDVAVEPVLTAVVAVIGYGNQGRAQALNLSERGVNVLIGNVPDGYAQQAAADGFQVLPIREAAAQADVILFLLPDEVQPEIFHSDLAPALHAGHVLAFASGYNVTYGFIKPPPAVDLIMVAPRMIGRGVMELPREGRGFPVLIGVENDASGKALDKALAIAAAIGAGNRGGCIVESSMREEVTIDLFTEHTWAPATVYLLKACCEMLIEAGVSPEAAILETYASGELGEIGRAMSELGLAGQMRLHSHTSQYGQLLWGERWVSGQARQLMQEALAAIQNGSFAQRWHAEQETGLDEFRARWQQLLDAPLFHHEEMLYRKLGRQPSRAAE
jgi:ketol-acid reductoisomerase